MASERPEMKDGEDQEEEVAVAVVEPRRRALFDRHTAKQVAAALAFSQTHSVIGAAVAFISVFIIQESQTENGHLSVGEVTWVVSGLPIGLVAGNLLSTVLTPILGYRRLVQLAAPVSICSWLTLALSFRFPLLLVARVVLGVALGVTDGPVRAYISEVTSERLRGPLGMLPHICITINMLAVYGVSSQTSWRNAVLFCGIAPSVPQFLATLLLPDAAKWLLAHGYPAEDARKSILFFRGHPETADLEVKAILSSLKGDVSSRSPVLVRMRAVLTQSRHRRPFLLLLVQLFLFVFNSGEAIANFTTVIFAAATSDSNPYYSTIWVVLARLLGFFLSAWLIERIGRVRLLQASAGVQMLGSVLVGFFFYYRSSLAAHGWLVLVGALIIFFTYGVGIAPVTWVYFSELTASAVRSVSLNVLLVCFGLMMFSFVHSYVWLESVLGIHGVFWALSVLSVVQIVFAQIWLPETRGLTLEQIQSR
ncbi:Facilitated trehalose transporter Tret1 [Amphibalanus amphitrite]|uniref:Facilitated trehalose transporter Tret1 n=2 Tax=Amphibalanus amphitrite TaxID=1232801 RepID=A0A6A4WIP5_AMPAM|nr:Facilitated trehalose transporter Tret1 [Amphibalanus amphitrite]